MTPVTPQPGLPTTSVPATRGSTGSDPARTAALAAPWRLGPVTFANHVGLAPMSGITDVPFRQICRRLGAGVLITEMMSARALVERGVADRLLRFAPGDHPVGVQLLGHEPAVMAEAARVAVDAGADFIDINAGCPARRAVGNGEGAALLLDLPLLGRIVEGVAAAVPVPVTVKMRRGFDPGHVAVPEAARVVEEAGAAMITLHGRLRSEYYSGQADWDCIAKTVAAVRIPVLGNGDVKTPQDAARMAGSTGCQGVMIGRAAQGSPWIFSRTLAYLRGGEDPGDPGPAARLDMALTHLRLMCDFYGERLGVINMRKHASWYIKGLRDATTVRELFMHAATPREMEDILLRYRATFRDTCDGPRG